MMRILALLSLLLFLAACTPATSLPPSASPTLEVGSPFPPAVPVPEHTPVPVALSTTQVGQAPYVLAGRGSLEVVQLVDGEYQQGSDPSSPDYVSVHMGQQIGFGDLNGDGWEDAAVPVGENYGGSGVFVYLAVYLNNYGTPLFHSAYWIDDRPTIYDVAIREGEVRMDALIHGFEDAMCCPSFHVTQTYRLAASGLVRTGFTSITSGGLERVITIDSPAAGQVVSGSVRVTGRVTIAPFENTLAYRIYGPTGEEVAAGPVMVSAPDFGAPGTFEALIDLSGLSPGTAIRLEIQDLSMADGSLLAMDSVGLVLR